MKTAGKYHRVWRRGFPMRNIYPHLCFLQTGISTFLADEFCPLFIKSGQPVGCISVEEEKSLSPNAEVTEHGRRGEGRGIFDRIYRLAKSRTSAIVREGVGGLDRIYRMNRIFRGRMLESVILNHVNPVNPVKKVSPKTPCLRSSVTSALGESHSVSGSPLRRQGSIVWNVGIILVRVEQDMFLADEPCPLFIKSGQLVGCIPVEEEKLLSPNAEETKQGRRGEGRGIFDRRYRLAESRTNAIARKEERGLDRIYRMNRILKDRAWKETTLNHVNPVNPVKKVPQKTPRLRSSVTSALGKSHSVSGSPLRRQGFIVWNVGIVLVCVEQDLLLADEPCPLFIKSGQLVGCIPVEEEKLLSSNAEKAELGRHGESGESLDRIYRMNRIFRERIWEINTLNHVNPVNPV